MAKKIRLDIVTPEKMAYSADVNMVIARTTSGDIGILPGHAALVAALVIWPLRIMTDEGELHVSVCSGFIEVQPEKITVLANCAELPEEIDIARAEAAKALAESTLRGIKDDLEVARAELALKRALTRLAVGRRHHKI